MHQNGKFPGKQPLPEAIYSGMCLGGTVTQCAAPGGTTRTPIYAGGAPEVIHHGWPWAHRTQCWELAEMRQGGKVPVCLIVIGSGRDTSEGKFSGVMKVSVSLWDPLDCSPPGSSVHGILQVSILEWVAIPFSKFKARTWYQSWFCFLSNDSGRSVARFKAEQFFSWVMSLSKSSDWYLRRQLSDNHYPSLEFKIQDIMWNIDCQISVCN